MPRTARTRSNSGIYHVVTRGVNKQDIFLDDEDMLLYLNCLRRLKDEAGCSVLGYCLMSNHVHLLLQETCAEAGCGGVPKLMHRLGTIIAKWYNQKYDRVGHVFQDRYGSTAVENDAYLLTVLRYIHQNPVKAKVAENCHSYPFSSYAAYARGQDPFGIAETGLALRMIGGLDRILQFFDQFGDDSPDLEIVHGKQTDDHQVEVALESLLSGKSRRELQNMGKVERDMILLRLKSMGGFSLRQMARVTGVSPATILRA